MRRTREAGLAMLLAAVFGAAAAIVSAGPAFAGSPASPPLTMDEVEIHGSGDLPERSFAPAPRPAHARAPVRETLLRARLLAPISPWENDDDDGDAARDRQASDARD